jgi:2',3'-cyclic-nucleotide 2'-phosphodiesterase (5'-nucleotidase family)
MKKLIYTVLFGFAAISANAQSAVTFRINASSDDAEEAVGNGVMYDTSSDLEMSYDDFVSDDQLVGLRFSSVSLPSGATITRAYIQFQVDEDKMNNPCELYVFGENNANPSTYSLTGFDISSRTYFNDSVMWMPGAWPSSSIGTQGYAQRTPDISSIVDSIMNQSGWTNGNPMAFMIKGSGTRTAEAYDGSSSGAPMLVIEYTMNPNNFLLQVMHASDLEGGVSAIQDAPAFAAIVDRLEDEFSNTVVISSGDNYIPGPFLSAANEDVVEDSLRAILSDFYGTPLNNLGTEGGRVDISIMNVIGFDASAFGNHEFDLGEGTVADVAFGTGNSTSLTWMGTQFPYLGANLDFSSSSLNSRYTDAVRLSSTFETDVTNPGSANNTDKIAPATIIEVGGDSIGVVGATTQLLATISSPGGVTVKGNPTGNDMAQLASVLQPYIDSLTNKGVDKIIVASHLQQFTLEQQLAGLLTGVDIILAGGSDFRLADNTDILRPGDSADGSYPFVTNDAQGDSVLIVSTDGEYSYVGRLVVEFDQNGHVLPSSVNELISGAYATIPEVVNGIYGTFNPYSQGSKGYYVERLTGSVIDVIVAKDGNTFGKTNFFLEGRRSAVRTEETNMGNLSADANLWMARQFDPTVAVSLKNGGGIRAEIGEIDYQSGALLPPQANPVAGRDSLEVSQLSIENTLRFNNGLTVVETTPGGLKALLEHGIGNWDGIATQGRMPQVGGVRFSFDPTQSAGSRIVNLALIDDMGVTVDSVIVNGSIQGDPNRTIKIVSLNFLVDNDGDGYPFSTETSNPVALDSANLPVTGAADFSEVGGEQDALAEYLSSEFSTNPYNEAETSADRDLRIQILSIRTDSVFEAGIAPDGQISGIDCANANANPATAEINNTYSGTITIDYTGGNGFDYPAQSVASTGVTGLTAELTAGSFMSGNGSVSYNVTGTASTAGTASFPINLGTQSCTFTLEVLDPSSIDEKDLGYVSIFPNPTRGKLFIQAEEIDLKEVSIFNMMGQVKYRSTQLNTMNEINLGGFSAGIYIVQLTTSNGVHTSAIQVSK